MNRRRGLVVAGVALALSVATMLSSSPSQAAAREDVARAYAPIFLQETNDPIKDLFSAYDFDGNWDGDDNAENMECYSDSSKCMTADNPTAPCAGQACPLVATVYYTVIETATHWFVQYMPYHPLDYKLTNGHEHDTESVLMTVAKDGTAVGSLRTMETRFHDVWYQYAIDSTIGKAGDDVDGPIHLDPATGRPMIHVQMVGHGFCGGYAPRNDLFPDLQLTCTHSDTPHLAKQGIVYSPDNPAQMPAAVDGQAVSGGYVLTELATSMWLHIKEIGAGMAFKSAIDFTGERCNLLTCPAQFGGDFEGNEGTSPGEPWAQEGGNGVNAIGDQFFDPAYTMSKRLAYPEAFSLEYCFNPYLAIKDSCSGMGADDGGAIDDGGAAGDSGVSTVPIEAGGGSRGSGDAGAGDEDTAGASGASGCGCAMGDRASAWDGVALFGVAVAGLRIARRRRNCGKP